MKARKLLFTSLTVCATLISSVAFAQFEGQISINLYGNDDQGNKEVSTMNLYSTSNRVILKGDESINLTSGVDASGILIRNDKRDFVVMMGENRALQFTKEELEGAFRMIGMMDDSKDKAGGEDIESNTNIIYTNRSRTINGFETTELRIENRENDNYISVWLTPEIDINWGILAEPWINIPKNVKKSADRVTQEFKSKNFPMLIEVNDQNKLQTIMEVTSVNRSSIAKAMVEIPSGVTLVGLNEMLFTLMMGN